MTCRACGMGHSPLVRCEVWAATNRIATNADATNSATNGKTANRRSREAYNRYQRDYMRARRARVPS